MATPGRKLLFSLGGCRPSAGLGAAEVCWGNLPEDAIVQKLERLRGHGRADCPVCAMRRAYAQRTALERINSRIGDGFRFERHNIRGKDKMTARFVLALAVMMALAFGVIRARAHDRMRSLVRPPPAQAA